MLDTSGGRSCDDCRRMIEDDQFIAVIFRVKAESNFKTVFHFHRECARRSVVILSDERGFPVGDGDIIPRRTNRYGDIVNDDGSYIRVPGACQCVVCGYVLQSSDEQYADPDCPRCEAERRGAALADALQADDAG